MGVEKYATFVSRARNVLTYDPGWSEDNITGGWRVVRPSLSQKLAPCTHACPAGVDVRGYIELVLKRQFGAALSLVRQAMPFPSVCGRVCHRPCEKACLRGQVDEPVRICHLKRFAADRGWRKAGRVRRAPAPKPEKIAIVGSGPAGLGAAYELARAGFVPTVFEALDRPGGLLFTGIPEFRLPRRALYREIKWILRHGIELRLNTKIGKDLSVSELLEAGCRAVFLAMGAQREKRLGIEGEELDGVHDGLRYLRTVNLGGSVVLGDRVAVVGGGNAAIDAARTALRNGAKEVTIIYRRTAAEMPADPEEVEAATEEGVKITFLAAPVKLKEENARLGEVVCTRMQLGEPDESGRRRPVPIPGSQFGVPVDSLVAAIGQEVDLSAVSDLKLQTGADGVIKVNPETLETSHPRVFAGGDAVLGPSTVIESIAQGKRAAKAIMASLGMFLPVEKETPVVELSEINPENISRAPARKIRSFPPQSRSRSFVEARKCFTRATALAEAARCLNCGKCNGCGICWLYCPDGVIRLGETAEIDLTYCKGCSICYEECPRAALVLEREE